MQKDSASELQPHEELPSIEPRRAEVVRPANSQTPKKVDLRRAREVTPKVIPVSGEGAASKQGGH